MRCGSQSMIRKSGNRFSLATNAERVCAEIMLKRISVISRFREIRRSEQPQQDFRGIEREPREPTDQRAVEADILQVAADIELDQRDQLRHVPGLDLVGDEGGDAALLL